MKSEVIVLQNIPDQIDFEDMSAINFTALSEFESLRVLDYRNHSTIRKWMHHSKIIDPTEHFRFVARLEDDVHNSYWVVRQRGSHNDLGVIYLNNVTDSNADFGIYVNPYQNARGIGTRLARFELHIAFEILKLDELNLTVFTENQRAIKFYGKLGFVENQNTDGQLQMSLSSKLYFSRQNVA